MQILSRNVINTQNFEKIFLVIFTLLLAFLTNWLLRYFVRTLTKLQARKAKTLLNLAQSLISIIVFSVSIYYIFKILKIDITPFIASAGIVGLAVGFGAQSLVKDFLSGIFLLVADAVAVGDIVRIGDAEGIVTNINLKSLTLQDENGALHIIPNSSVGIVVNLSRHKARVNLTFILPTSTDIDKVTTILRETINQLEQDSQFKAMVLPGSEVKGIEEFIPPKRMAIRTLIYAKPSHRWAVAQRFRYLVKKAFEEKGIEFG